MTIEMEVDPKLRTIWCGNLASRVTEEILYELFLQAGPLECISMPKDKHGSNRGYAFITFKHECSVPYAKSLFEGTALFDRELRLTARVNDAARQNTSMLNTPVLPACFLPLPNPTLNDPKSNFSREDNKVHKIESSPFDNQTYVSNGNVNNSYPFMQFPIQTNTSIPPLMSATCNPFLSTLQQNQRNNSNFQQNNHINKNSNRCGEKDLRDRIRERDRNRYDHKRDSYERQHRRHSK